MIISLLIITLGFLWLGYETNWLTIRLPIGEADCKTAANSKYLIDCLGKLGDSKVELKITTPSSPMVFKVDQKTEVIMPMFVQW